MKSINNVNRILWAREYWFKALKCKMWLTNTKPFFSQREGNIEILQKLFPYIWVSYNFLWKSINSINRIFWATEYWLNCLKCQIWLVNIETFFWKKEADVETLQKLSPYILASYKFVLLSVNSLNRIFRATKYWFKALECQSWFTYTKPFFWEREANLETFQNFSPYIWVSY